MFEGSVQRFDHDPDRFEQRRGLKVRKLPKGYALLIMVSVLGGCASSTQSYSAATSHVVENEKILNIPFSKAWDQYVAELTKSFFVINNIDKESRIINVSFSVNKPSEFIDCGVTTRTAAHPSIGTQTFTYPTADDSTYLAGVDGTNELWNVQRNTNLEGRANIYMAPQGNNTLLRVNARYVWSVDVTGQSNVGQVDHSSNTVSFSTGGAALRVVMVPTSHVHQRAL